MQMAYLSAVSCHGNPFGMEQYRLKYDYGSVTTDRRSISRRHKHEFTIKGVKIMAAFKRASIEKWLYHRKK